MDPREGMQGERFSSHPERGLAACRDFLVILDSFFVVFCCCFFGFVFGSFWGVIWECFLVTLGSFFALFFVRFLMQLFRESQRHRSILESFFGFVEPKTASK